MEGRRGHPSRLKSGSAKKLKHRAWAPAKHIPGNDSLATVDDAGDLIRGTPTGPRSSVLVPRRTKKLMSAYTRGQNEFPARHSLFEPARRRDVGVPKERRPSGRIEPPKRRMNSLKRFLRGPYRVDCPVEHAFKLIRLIDDFPNTVRKLLSCKPVQDNRCNSYLTLKIFDPRLSLHKTRHQLQRRC